MSSVKPQVKAALLIGPTGSGKTPLGDHIQAHGTNGKKCFHFDFGNELREVARSQTAPQGFNQEEHSFIKAVLEKGLLLENEHFHIAEKILRNFLDQKGFQEQDLLVLNGLPRHVGQAKDLRRTVKVRSVIVLDCRPEDVFNRIKSNTGKDRTGRDDDSLEMIREKLITFNERTAPLTDFYSDAGSNIFRIKVTATSNTEQLYSEFLRL